MIILLSCIAVGLIFLIGNTCRSLYMIVRAGIPRTQQLIDASATYSNIANGTLPVIDDGIDVPIDEHTAFHINKNGKRVIESNRTVRKDYY